MRLKQQGKEGGSIHLRRSIVKNPYATGSYKQGSTQAHHLNQPRFHHGALKNSPAVLPEIVIGDPPRPGKRLFRHQLSPVAKKLMPALAATHHGPLLGRGDIDMLFTVGTVQIHSPLI